MRAIWVAALVLGLATTAGCATRQTEATAPMVSYAYSDDDDYEVIEEEAELYCAEQYGRDEAVLVDRSVEGNEYEATFACE